MKEEKTIEQLQEAIENNSVTSELKAYIARLQEKLAKVRSRSGNYGQIDFSPYIKRISSEIGCQQEPQPAILESSCRRRRDKTSNAI